MGYYGNNDSTMDDYPTDSYILGIRCLIVGGVHGAMEGESAFGDEPSCKNSIEAFPMVFRLFLLLLRALRVGAEKPFDNWFLHYCVRGSTLLPSHPCASTGRTTKPGRYFTVGACSVSILGTYHKQYSEFDLQNITLRCDYYTLLGEASVCGGESKAEKRSHPANHTLGIL